MKEAFDFCDLDKNGAITKDEIVTIFKQLSMFVMESAGIKFAELPEERQAEMKAKFGEKMDQIMGIMDLNGDGRITFEEFCKGAPQLLAMAPENM